MKILITCPVDGLEAGKSYDVADEKALEYIADEKAILAEQPKKAKAVKYDNG